MSEIEEEKEPPKELPVLRRMTKRQLQEVYDLLEEGKTLEEISDYFQKRYKCKPLSKDRLRKHRTKFYKVKRENEKSNSKKERGGDIKLHHPQPLVFTITNQDNQITKEDLFYTLKLFKSLEGTAKN